jgi:hypothetical protein
MRPYHVNVRFYDLDSEHVGLLQPAPKWCETHIRTLWYEHKVEYQHQVKVNSYDHANPGWCWTIFPITPRFKALFTTITNGHRLRLTAAEHAELVRYDYAKMSAMMAPLRDELLRAVMHPRNLKRARELALV